MATRKKSTGGTDVAVIDGKTGTAIAPADIAASIAEMLQQQQGTTGSTASKGIKIGQDKKFELPDGSKHEIIEVVIVDYISFNAMYQGTYDPKNPQPPVCAAKAKKIIDLVPFDQSPERQADNCETCPMNEFGSSGNGKMCKNQRSLAILPANFADEEDPQLTVLNVSPTAIKRFDKYIQAIGTKGKVPLQLVTEIGFDPGVSYASLTFKPVEELSNEEVSLALTKVQEAQKMLLEAPDFTPRQAPAAPAPAGRGSRQAATKPAANSRRRAS